MKEGKYDRLFQMMSEFDNPVSLNGAIDDLGLILQEMPLGDMGTETAQQIMRFRSMLSDRLSDIIKSGSRKRKIVQTECFLSGNPEEWFCFGRIHKNNDDTLIPEEEIPVDWTAKGQIVH